MNKIELRQEYEAKLLDYKAKSWETGNPLNNLWKTNHSLQLTRLGLFVFKKYVKENNVPMLTIELANGRSISELLMIANTMNVPFFITEDHTSGKVILCTIESDRSIMLIMGNGNVINWANMYQTD
jgi:hypothetical protein